MEIQVERQLMQDLKNDSAHFTALYDEYFSDIYRYVARRVEGQDILREIVKLVFLDAYGQRTTAPEDVGFKVWLYGLAWQRVKGYVEKSVSGTGPALQSPVLEGASLSEGVYDDEFKLKQQSDTFFSTLTSAEREVVRLKFFEEVTDGELKYVLGIEKGLIGPTIYKVLKRGYEILFGKSEDNRGVYYGELHSFLSRLKRIEKIPSPDGLKLEIKLELQQRQGGAAVGGDAGRADSKTVDDMSVGEMPADGEDIKYPVAGGATAGAGLGRTGSDDPAKIFVNAAKGMSKKEVNEITEEYVREREGLKAEVEGMPEKVLHDAFGGGAFDASTDSIGFDAEGLSDIPGLESLKIPVDEISEQVGAAGKIEEIPVEHYAYSDEYDEPLGELRERVMDSWERWKYYFSIAPMVLFVFAAVVVVSAVLFGRVTDEGVTGLAYEIDYQEGFSKWDSDFEELDDYGLRVSIEDELVRKIAGRKRIEHVEVNLIRPVRENARIGLDFKLLKNGWLEYKIDVLRGGSYRVVGMKKIVSK